MENRYSQLRDFILKQMRMSHIYQPVMLIQLLQNNGLASVTEIAKVLLSYDTAQIEYYENVTKNMVGKVLTNRGVVTKDANEYSLVGFSELNQSQREQLIECCEQRISQFLEKRGDTVWAHRKQSAGYISGTLRYEVLKKAKSRCELCGISSHEKALEVDHIIPRSKGGSDEMHNLQALCYSCNAMKSNRDDADLRSVRESYGNREDDCAFCEIPETRIVQENELAYATRDAFPVTKYHTLIIPKRHAPDYFDLYQPERNAINQLLDVQRNRILARDGSVTGFNIGFNIGPDAGQTVLHCHMHIIPRRKGDTPKPRGGIRGVIPDKQAY